MTYILKGAGKYFALRGSQGDRSHMEDTFSTFSSLPGVDIPNIFAVFDGHGGAQCSNYCKDALPQILAKHPELKTNIKRAIIESFQEVDQNYCRLAQRTGNLEDGTTASLLYVVPSSSSDKSLRYFLASCGDSRAILVKSDGSVVALSHDHDLKRRDEAERIIKSGGRIRKDDYGARVVSDTVGELAVTRAIGDADFKNIGVISEPEISEGYLNFGEDSYIILASDGLWNQMTNKEVGLFLTKHKEFNNKTKLAAKLELLIKLAKKRDNDLSRKFNEELSCDNVTVLGVNVKSMIPKLLKETNKIHKTQLELAAKRKKTLIIKGISPVGYTSELLLWKNPIRSFLWVCIGCLFYFLSEIALYSNLTLMSYLVLSQLLVDTFVINFTPVLRKLKLVGSSFDSIIFIEQGRFTTDELVDRTASLVKREYEKFYTTWHIYVHEASADNILIALRNISYLFTPFALPTLLFIAFLSCFSLPVTYDRNRTLLDSFYNRLKTRYYQVLDSFKLRR